MKTITKTITVNVPVQRAYNQWTQFEDFTAFMDGVKQVKQVDDRRLQWKASIGGRLKEWNAEIIEQIPDKRIRWRSTSGAKNSGTVTFTAIGEQKSSVDVRLQYEPDGVAERLGDALGLVAGKVGADLECFKRFVEKRPTDTRGWRGEIRGQPATNTWGAT